MRSPRDVRALADPDDRLHQQSDCDLGVDFARLVDALQVFVDRHFAPVWGTHAKLVRSKEFIDGAWALVFLDNPDAAGLEGYHELTRHRLPLSKVFVKTTLKDGEKVSVTASHELAEMLVDPAANLWAEGPHSTLYAYTKWLTPSKKCTSGSTGFR